MANKPAPRGSFDDQLVLYRYFLRQLRVDSLHALSDPLNSWDYEGVNESGNTYFIEHIARICKRKGSPVPEEKLRLYDGNICRHTRRLSEKRGTVRWKYFQYVALLFTEMYLDRYFSDPEELCIELNRWLEEQRNESLGRIDFEPYTPQRLNKLAFMCATGSGKTLLMHMNILQYLHYFQRARRRNSRLALNKVIVLASNQVMSQQHLEELTLSSIPAVRFEKARGLLEEQNAVLVIDMNRLKEEGKIKTVAVDSFEQNNLVLVDEGHRGLSGEVWYDYRTRLSAEGFAFEYSATFKQALNPGSQKPEERALMEEYGKSILMDYSFKHFYQDGYGKDYRIYNLRKSIAEEQRQLYMTGCLLTFYQQLKLFDKEQKGLQDFLLEKPLLVFVGNRVTAKTSKEERTDIEEVLDFINRFLQNRPLSVRRIQAVLEDDTGLIDGSGNELFYRDFEALREYFAPDPNPAEIFSDVLRLVFNTDGSAAEPRLYLENIRQAPGEIGLRAGYGEYFGVISVGDTAGLLKSCEARGMVTKTEEFISQSLFQSINDRNSSIKVLIGSRKFTEGWNSWRVSTMCLINFAKGEGPQAIQLFGRGVRLRGYLGCLKRSSKLDLPEQPPRYLSLLETLTIFGIKAQYMEDFNRYLEREGANSGIACKLLLPALSRFPRLEGRTLYLPRLKGGVSFRRQARRLLLRAPGEDPDFLRYLLKHRVVIDCRSKIQTIDSTFGFALKSVPNELVLPPEALPVLDYRRIFEELEQYKSEKRYFNICLAPEQLLPILQAEGWYALLLPDDQLRVDSLAKLETAADYAVMVLKAYMDRFFRYEKGRWEAPRLEYAPLEADDSNFVEEYAVTYTLQNPLDTTGEELKSFLGEISAELSAGGGLAGYKREFLRGRIAVFDLPSHLYAPLICLEESGLNIQVSPVALNHHEMLFVDYLRTYVDRHSERLEGKSLFLMRNQSKTGVGFFEAEGFYPDFILWIDTEDTQYITFIDPKGLLHIRPEDPKVEFHKTVKQLEARLAPTAPGKTVVLNSFIMSATPPGQLRQWWMMNRPQWEERNVYTLDHPECVELMMDKILR